jgi:hypothetical protein
MLSFVSRQRAGAFALLALLTLHMHAATVSAKRSGHHGTKSTKSFQHFAEVSGW